MNDAADVCGEMSDVNKINSANERVRITHEEKSNNNNNGTQTAWRGGKK